MIMIMKINAVGVVLTQQLKIGMNSTHWTILVITD